MSPDSVFALTLDSLKHEIARSPAPSQLEARCCYWSAVLATRRHAEGDTVRRLTVRAIELCDSAAYPYDMARFRHLEALMLFRDNSFRQHEVFRDCYDYFAEQKDGFMTAWLALDLGAVASRIAASASGSRASGKPSCTAASTQALVMAMAWG